MNHTPGTWVAQTYSMPTGADDFDCGASVYAEDGNGHRKEVAFVKELPEQEANVKLMAAAPELLAALETLVDKVEARWHQEIKYAPVAIGQYLMAARDAIGKAKAQS